MRKAAKVIPWALALLIAVAFFLHREPIEQAPNRPQRRAQLAESAPLPAAIVSEPVTSRPPARTRTPDASAPEAHSPARPGTIRGSVKIRGTPPRRRTARLDADPKCECLYVGPLLMDDLVVDANGGVQWAFVYVQSGLTGAPSEPPQAPVMLDQVGCTFRPHVLGIRVHQPLVILNSDDLLHNCHAMTQENREFNIGLVFGSEYRRAFEKPEVMIKMKCHIHPWMTAWIGVMEHPYFSATNETGSYVIPGLPPGRYTILVWHEKYVSLASAVEVRSGEDVPLDFLLEARKTD